MAGVGSIPVIGGVLGEPDPRLISLGGDINEASLKEVGHCGAG
jgi:hypothetical protein